MKKNFKIPVLSILIFLGVIMLVVIGGCAEKTQFEVGSYEETSFGPDKPIVAKQFSSLEEFNIFIKRYEEGRYDYYEKGIGIEEEAALTGGRVTTSGGGVGGASAVMAGGAGFEEVSTKDFSPTNNQILNVDEADIIKTDGEYIYTISKDNLYIIKAYPGSEAEIMSVINFGENKPINLFIDKEKLAVFGNFYDLDFLKEMDFTPRTGVSFFNIYDISNKLDPVLEKEYEFEGEYFDARMIGDYVYFIVKNYVYRGLQTPAIIEDSTRGSLSVSDIYYYNIMYRSPELVSVYSINIAEPSKDINSKTIVVEGGQNLYMSEENIYLTYTQIIDESDLMKDIMNEVLEDYLTDSDKKLIEKIKTTDNDVLSQYEKEVKIMSLYQSYLNYMNENERQKLEEKIEDLFEKKLDEYVYLEFTVINKIGVDGGNIDIKDSGRVPGHIINQFSLDENNGILRIATTISPRWSRIGREESINNVYTLNKNIKKIGGLEGIAVGEQIYSTRFIGDKLYMVTFRQVDPFFVIDLSNPYAVEEIGELKIPGFSRYLHPYDETTIIGIGQEVTETGGISGLKISLFDVSDFENPKEIAKFVTEEEYADSTALYEHKAFLFSKEKELLVIPAYNCDWNGDDSYNGAFVFKINKKDIKLRGLIDHTGMWKTGSEDPTVELEIRCGYEALVERSLYINELLYTKSSDLLRINRIEDLGSVKSIRLPEIRGTKIKRY